MRSLRIPALSSWNWRDWTSECQEAISNNVTVWRWLIDGKLKPHTIDEFRFCENQELLSSWHYWCILGAVLPHQRCGKYVVHAKASVQGTPGTCMAGQRISWIGCSDLRVHLTSDQQSPADLMGSKAKRLVFRIAESSRFASIFGHEAMGSC